MRSSPPLAVFVCAVLVPLAAGLAETGFSFKDSPGQFRDVLRDGKVVARYMNGHDISTKERRDETYKPYLHVFDPTGTTPITKGAGGTLPHHRGIYIGWNKLAVGGKTYDRWHMKGGDQVHEKFLAQTADKERATFTSLVRWQGEKPVDTIIEEERTLTFLPAPAPGYVLIDMVSKLKAVAGETVLGGDVEHAGLHFRPADNIDRSKTTFLYPVENAQPKKDRDYPWFGESFTLPGGRFSVVYLNHPANPKNAVISAYRDYGRFGAFFTATIPAGGTQEIRARFLVAAGEMPSAETIQNAWNDYAGKQEPTPKTTSKPAEGTKFPDPTKPDPKKAATPAPKTGALSSKRAAARLCANPPKPTADPDSTVETSAAEAKPGTASTPVTGPRRAGGGPTNPEIRFKLPPPPVLTPQQALKTFKVAPGFKIELVAAEPLIEAPIAVSWDDQGRMYVCEMRGYMHDMDGAGEDQPVGRVSRLEDTNGDGVMDKSVVFADKLLMPRAVLALGDGALIAEPPLLTWYRDTDGDGVADKKEPVGDSFGRKGGQPEHMANSPTWMLDNWITASGHNNRYRFQNGKFLTDTAAGAGQWGRTQDDWGRAYFNYNSDLLRADLVPASYYARNTRLAAPAALNVKLLADQSVWPAAPTPGVNRGYSGILRDDGTLKSATATCGAAIYRGDLFPAEYRGNAFIPEPSANLVKRVVIDEKEPSLAGRNANTGQEFLTSTDERFRPVNAYTGPDGALYVVDMARGVIQHKAFLTYYLAANITERQLEQPVNLGRIYRIVPEGAKPAPVKLPRETAKVVPLLAHANGWVRDTAQRVLIERGDAAAVPPLKQLATAGATPQARVQALWTLEGLGALSPEVVTAALGDREPKVRTAAVRVADKTLAPELLKLSKDPSAEVRLHLAFQLSGQPGAEIEPALLALLAQNPTPLFADAVAIGYAGREVELLETLLKHPAADQFVASSIFQTLAGGVMKERRAPRVARLLELAAAQTADSPHQLALLNGMAGKAPAKNAKAAPAANPVRLAALPAAFADWETKASPKAKPLLARIDAQIAWPGKAGVPEPAKVAPLTAAERALFEKGKTLYATICGACHQPNGAGMAGLAPPLVESEWVLGPADRGIRIILGGLTGPIEVSGTKWQLDMPGLPMLSDEDVAGVLTYLRREWEHTGKPVSPAEVAKVRAATQGRTAAWTAAELLRPIDTKTASAKK